MTEADRTRWDEKYRLKSELPSPAPSGWLRDIVSELTPGRAWDVACGAGQNALLLASLGWRVDAVDISPVGLEIGRRSAAENPGFIQWIAADLDAYLPSVGTYDLVTVFRFLDRTRLPGLIQKSLKPGGRVIYETFVEGQFERQDNHLKNSDFILKSGELPTLLLELDTVSYSEEILSDRTVARWIGIKP